MAAKKSIGNRSNRARANRSSFTLPIRLERAIDAERRRLSKAQSILVCLAVTLESPTSQCSDNLDLGQVAEVVRDLVNSSIERLDSVNLSKILRASPDPG
jgi:hypothetical protein